MFLHSINVAPLRCKLSTGLSTILPLLNLCVSHFLSARFFLGWMEVKLRWSLRLLFLFCRLVGILCDPSGSGENGGLGNEHRESGVSAYQAT